MLSTPQYFPNKIKANIQKPNTQPPLTTHSK
jgi:hypothetical protein